jgi:hypothetical protein
MLLILKSKIYFKIVNTIRNSLELKIDSEVLVNLLFFEVYNYKKNRARISAHCFLHTHLGYIHMRF